MHSSNHNTSVETIILKSKLIINRGMIPFLLPAKPANNLPFSKLGYADTWKMHAVQNFRRQKRGGFACLHALYADGKHKIGVWHSN